MQTVLSCLQDFHDGRLLALAGVVCVVGVYAAFSISTHAGRTQGRSRRNWAIIAIVAAASTAWATHMTALLAFQPGMPSAFEPVLMAVSFFAALGGIGIGMSMAIGRRGRAYRFAAGVVLGLGIVLLHYIGQASYRVRGTVSFEATLVAGSILLSLLAYGVAIIAAAERDRRVRNLAAPLLIAGIAILHIGGMSALRLEFDPRITLGNYALSPAVVAPIVAAVSLGLVVLALAGLRFSLSAATRLRRDRQRLRELANLAVEGLAVCNAGIITSVNDSLEKLSGLHSEDLVGRPVADLLPGVSIDALPDREERDAGLLGADGIVVPVRILRSDVMLGSKPQVVVAFRDQRERLQTETRMRTLAFSDPLTGLPNRSHFGDHLDAHLNRCRSEGRSFAMLLIDLDRFKWVNDTLGHGVGDELLRRVAVRLKRAIRQGDFAGRLGGDEFALLVEGGSSEARTVAENVIELLGRPFLINGHAIDLAASVGIALAPEDGAAPELLSRNADLALYRSKEVGGSVYRFFAAEMNEKAQQRHALELELRGALGRNEFVVHYQPQIDPKSGEFQGAEALVRWIHPERGMIAPDSFIPLAEEIGLIGAIGERVLRTACEEASNWPDHLSIAVNLSPMQLRDRNLAAVVAAILRETELDARRLELEVTETALIQDDETTYENLRALQASGIRISMDDFGTGYSSLSYLRRFPFDKLKIDRSFIQQIPSDHDSIAIVEAMTTLGTRLGMTVTIEGVETIAQQSFAADRGCDQVQGYLISRPVPASDVRAMFEAASSRRLTACQA